MDWQEEKAMMERERRKLIRKIASVEQRLRSAHDLKVAAETRAHDARAQYKSMKSHLERCETDARRYQWLRCRGVRFPGCANWLHDRATDRAVDAGIAEDGRPPTVTEQQLSRRRPRQPLNPVLPAAFGAHEHE